MEAETKLVVLLRPLEALIAGRSIHEIVVFSLDWFFLAITGIVN